MVASASKHTKTAARRPRLETCVPTRSTAVGLFVVSRIMMACAAIANTPHLVDGVIEQRESILTFSLNTERKASPYRCVVQHMRGSYCISLDRPEKRCTYAWMLRTLPGRSGSSRHTQRKRGNPTVPRSHKHIISAPFCLLHLRSLSFARAVPLSLPSPVLETLHRPAVR